MMVERKCINCLRRQNEPDAHRMVYCSQHGCNVYADSVACPNFDYYDGF